MLRARTRLRLKSFKYFTTESCPMIKEESCLGKNASRKSPERKEKRERGNAIRWHEFDVRSRRRRSICVSSVRYRQSDREIERIWSARNVRVVEKEETEYRGTEISLQ